MDLKDFYAYVIIPLSIIPFILSFSILIKMKREKQQLTIIHYLLLISTFLISILINYFFVVYIIQNEFT